jgi:hypothetical protein
MIVEYIRNDLVAHRRLLDAIKPFMGEIADMRHYKPTPIAWRRS